MTVQQFIQNYREAFGSKVPLPLLFGYSTEAVAETPKIGGCFFKGLQGQLLVGFASFKIPFNCRAQERQTNSQYYTLLLNKHKKNLPINYPY